MIRVTIEMVPGGFEDAKYTMHVIEVWNQIGTTLANRNRGDYGYRISRKLARSVVAGATPSWTRTGTIKDFPRSAKNSVHLLLAVLRDAYEH